jgi:hypothetical protein
MALVVFMSGDCPRCVQFPPNRDFTFVISRALEDVCSMASIAVLGKFADGLTHACVSAHLCVWSSAAFLFTTNLCFPGNVCSMVPAECSV